MNTSGEAAEQVMRMSLEGAEILIKLTGSGAKNAAVLLYSIYKEQNKTRGKERLTNMLRSGKPLKVYTFKRDNLEKFKEVAKEYGITVISGVFFPCERYAIFLAISFLLIVRRFSPSTVISPSDSGKMPSITLSSVLFPHPFTPMILVSLPFSKNALTSLSTVCFPYPADIRFSSSISVSSFSFEQNEDKERSTKECHNNSHGQLIRCEYDSCKRIT